MAEELQSLLDRIQSEGIDKTRKEGDQLIADAKDKAATIIKEAEEKAAAAKAKADQEATAFEARGIKALEQASRDLIITVGTEVNKVFAGIVGKALDTQYDAQIIGKMLIELAKADAAGKDFSAAVSTADKDALMAFARSEFTQQTKAGLEIAADSEVLKGFKVTMKGDDAYSDYSKDAIAESLMSFLRPQLAEMVKTAVKKED